MRDIKITLSLASIYLLLFGAVVAHLIFDLDVEYVVIFCWNVNRITMLGLTLVFLATAYIIQLLLSIFSSKYGKKDWVVWLHLMSGIILILGIMLLHFILNSDFENRLVIFDTTLVLIVIAWSIEMYIQTRLNMRGTL